MSYSWVKIIIIFSSTVFSILIIMLTLNIITVDEVITMLKFSPEQGKVFKLMVSRIREVTDNLLDILSQLMSKLFEWVGIKTDLSKVKIDINGSGYPPSPPSP